MIEISFGAFANCTNLASVTLSNNITVLWHNLFRNCTSLTSITIPDGVTRIDGFYGCNNLRSINIPNSVTQIDQEAFYDCSSLTNLTLPNGLTWIGKDALYNTPYYNNESNWENGVLYYGNYLLNSRTTLSGNYQIKPGTVLTATSAFQNCSGLTGITIPESVTTICNSAFEGCSGLTSITIPDTVTNFYGSSTFQGCNFPKVYVYLMFICSRIVLLLRILRFRKT